MIKPLFQKILVAVNGSEASMHAAMYAICMAKVYRCSVKAVYVVDTATIKQLTMSKFLVQEEGYATEAGLTSDGDKNLTYVSNLAKSKGVKIEAELRKGAVWSELITAADEYKADLILLGGKLHSDTSTIIHDEINADNRSVIGSAHCSVLVVKEKYVEQMYKLC